MTIETLKSVGSKNRHQVRQEMLFAIAQKEAELEAMKRNVPSPFATVFQLRATSPVKLKVYVYCDSEESARHKALEMLRLNYGKDEAITLHGSARKFEGWEGIIALGAEVGEIFKKLSESDASELSSDIDEFLKHRNRPTDAMRLGHKETILFEHEKFKTHRH